MNNYYYCIYLYEFPNGKKYVGQAKDFNKRHSQHKWKCSDKCVVDKAINKYGMENIKITILEYDIEPNEINNREQYYIEKYDCLVKNGKGYNVIDKSFGGSVYDFLSDEALEEWKIKQRKRCKYEVPLKDINPSKNIGKGTGNYEHRQQSPNVVAINCKTGEIIIGNGYDRMSKKLQDLHGVKYDKNNIRKICKLNDTREEKFRALGKDDKKYILVHEDYYIILHEKGLL